uniref:Leo1-like protein n=1 Tax=Syphacia muris TaxID=451379 RepID=A0A0N5ABA6_9BILA
TVDSSEDKRQPQNHFCAQISSDDDDDDDSDGGGGETLENAENAGTGREQDLDDIDLSDSNNDENEEDRLTEDDIIGPRLYADPDAQDEEQDVRPPTIVEVNTARIDPSFTSSGLYFVKLPNFLSVDSRPFDHEHYEDEIDEDEYLDEEGRARLKLKVENTLRWRYRLDDEGNLTKQSNANIIRWSDGTMSLKLGNELFDVQCQPMQRDNHLFMRQGAGLQGHKLVFRPFSTDSVTHRKVTLSMADRTNKSQKVKVLNNVGQDPEAQKAVWYFEPFNFCEEGIASIKRRYKAAAFDEAPIIGRSDSEESDSQRLHDAQKDSDESDSDQVCFPASCCKFFIMVNRLFLITGKAHSEKEKGHY